MTSENPTNKKKFDPASLRLNQGYLDESPVQREIMRIFPATNEERLGPIWRISRHCDAGLPRPGGGRPTSRAVVVINRALAPGVPIATIARAYGVDKNDIRHIRRFLDDPSLLKTITAESILRLEARNDELYTAHWKSLATIARSLSPFALPDAITSASTYVDLSEMSPQFALNARQVGRIIQRETKRRNLSWLNVRRRVFEECDTQRIKIFSQRYYLSLFDFGADSYSSLNPFDQLIERQDAPMLPPADGLGDNPVLQPAAASQIVHWLDLYGLPYHDRGYSGEIIPWIWLHLNWVPPEISRMRVVKGLFAGQHPSALARRGRYYQNVEARAAVVRVSDRGGCCTPGDGVRSCGQSPADYGKGGDVEKYFIQHPPYRPQSPSSPPQRDQGRSR